MFLFNLNSVQTRKSTQSIDECRNARLRARLLTHNQTHDNVCEDNPRKVEYLLRLVIVGDVHALHNAIVDTILVMPLWHPIVIKRRAILPRVAGYEDRDDVIRYRLDNESQNFLTDARSGFKYLQRQRLCWGVERVVLIFQLIFGDRDVDVWMHVHFECMLPRHLLVLVDVKSIQQ